MRKGSFVFKPFFLAAVFFLTGCASQPAQVPAQSSADLTRVNREQAATLKSLDKEIQRLNEEIQRKQSDQEASQKGLVQTGDLKKSQTDLEAGLNHSLQAGDLSISMEDKGLVVTVLDRVLFDPGKADLKDGAKETLSTVAQVLNGEIKDHLVYVEGHTDDQPIRLSAWRSNWELSTARAAEVIHYFIEEGGVKPQRLAATGYGEFHPVVRNDSAQGRMKNRRVEIVISAKKVED